MIGAIAIFCFFGGLIVTVVYACLCVGTDRTPHWSEYQWQGDDE